MTKNECIERLLSQVDDWEVEDLIEYAKEAMAENLRQLPAEEVRLLYKSYEKDLESEKP